MWLDNKLYTAGFELGGEVMELLYRQNHTKVRDGNIVRIHGIVVISSSEIISSVVANNLMAIQVVVNPSKGGAALLTAQGAAIECSGGLEVMNW